MVLWVEACAGSAPLTIYGKIRGGWGGGKGLHSTVGGGMYWLRPFAHIWGGKGGEEGLHRTVGRGMCWLRPFAHIWRLSKDVGGASCSEGRGQAVTPYMPIYGYSMKWAGLVYKGGGVNQWVCP